MFANISCVSILAGMTGGLETLASQLNGAGGLTIHFPLLFTCFLYTYILFSPLLLAQLGKYRQVGVVLQRSILILLMMMIPILAIWHYCESIFIALGMEPEVCKVVGKYLGIRVLTLPIDCICLSYEKFLMAVTLTISTLSTLTLSTLTLRWG